ncbi:hypothetical protein PANT111_190051 [Pantoea brenneri]|uniref:Uncharacterized protein n=1 Tax=Pantoea brenneri TaxID=472694 RepID=A0AAX3J8D6_9GAMM|nr:hypothetical protein PANT111_190051 [Pantoea brenneri]
MAEVQQVNNSLDKHSHYQSENYYRL